MIYLFIILNVAILIAYFAELMTDYIAIFEAPGKLKDKKVYIIRAVAVFAMTFIAQYFLFNAFWVTNDNFLYLLQYGKMDWIK